MERVLGIARSWGALVAPLSALVLPKCPLCLLPLLALAGVTLPSMARLQWLIVVITTLSIGMFILTSQVRGSRVLAAFAAPLLAGGRLLTSEPAYWIGVALLVAAALVHIRRRTVNCAGSCGE